MPELYLLIIFSAVFAPSLALLLILLSLFGWMGLSDYVRAEFLRNRQLDYVRAARSLGVSNWQIITRHLLPNSMTPVVTFLPFRMSGAILALDLARFSGFGRAARHAVAGRIAVARQKQHRCLVDLAGHVCRAGDHLAAADLHGRRAARCAGPAQGGRAMSANPLLEVQGLSVSFADQEVVHGIDFSIAVGERVALVGESGSGKTVSALSLLRLVANAKMCGQASFDGHDLLSMPESELRAMRGRDIAMIFQEPMTALNPLMTVGDQIAEVLMLKTGLAKAQAAQKAIDLLAETGIPEPARRAQAFPHQLSGGQRQRAMIAMALACQPKLLLADEPTTALDVSLRGQILDLLTRLQQSHGMAVLLITHDLNLVRRFADRVIVMESGWIVEQGPPPRYLPGHSMPTPSA